MSIDSSPPNIVTKTAKGPPSRSWHTLLTGRDLPTSDVAHQTVGKLVGLAIFAADALSSTGYATEAILFTLAAAGAGAFHLVMPISIAIVVLIVIVTTSYEQTIHAYTGGGGAYIVARDNLGEAPAQVAGGALLTDYILTVAVSVSSGVAQIVSAFPFLYSYRVLITVALVIFMMVINLRGVRESGRAFAIPTMLFVVLMGIMLLTGFVRYFTGTLGTLVNPPEMVAVGAVTAVTPFLLLHAFSSGTSAMTGIEAISNGVTAFKEPRSRNAAVTLVWMSTILIALFLGITFLAHQIGALPSETETIISQIGRAVYGEDSIIYILVLAGTALILLMAANTSYAGFPRLAALAASDGFLPRQLTYRGSRLVYSRGIIALALIACALIIAFRASVTALIPLYAIGVFLSFTLSQLGMARRWWKIGHLLPGQEVQERGSKLQYRPGWQQRMTINGFGAVCTAVVMLVFGVTKFREGAWIVVFLTPALVLAFFRIHRHYKTLAAQLSLDNYHPSARRRPRHVVIVPIGGVHQGTLVALQYAQALSEDVTAIHVSTDPDEVIKIQEKWETWGEGTRLVILDSPFRLFLEPLLGYLEMVSARRRPGDLITIVVPHFVPRRWWHNLLHTQTAVMLRLALLFKPGITVTDVPYHVD